MTEFAACNQPQIAPQKQTPNPVCGSNYAKACAWYMGFLTIFSLCIILGRDPGYPFVIPICLVFAKHALDLRKASGSMEIPGGLFSSSLLARMEQGVFFAFCPFNAESWVIINFTAQESLF